MAVEQELATVRAFSTIFNKYSHVSPSPTISTTFGAALVLWTATAGSSTAVDAVTHLLVTLCVLLVTKQEPGLGSREMTSMASQDVRTLLILRQ